MSSTPTSPQGDPLYTEIAGRAVELAKLFALFVATPPIPTATGVFAIELTTPHGPSTGGGAQALQHIAFVHGELTIVVGSVDQGASTIELRSYDHLEALFRRRWHEPLPFDRVAFDAFLTRVRAFARSQLFVIVIKDLAAIEPAAAAPTSRWGYVGAAMVLLAIAWMILRILGVA